MKFLEKNDQKMKFFEKNDKFWLHFQILKIKKNHRFFLLAIENIMKFVSLFWNFRLSSSCFFRYFFSRFFTKTHLWIVYFDKFMCKNVSLIENFHFFQAWKKYIEKFWNFRQNFFSKIFIFQDEKEKSAAEKVGVSGGFLGSIVQSEGINGIRLNLTTDAIQSIFSTYPAGQNLC